MSCTNRHFSERVCLVYYSASLRLIEDTIPLGLSTVKGQSAQKAGNSFQILLAVLLISSSLFRRLVEFEIDVARLLSALLLGRISKTEQTEKQAVFREKPRKGILYYFCRCPNIGNVKSLFKML